MSIKERILTLRLLEKIANYPELAKDAGIENVPDVLTHYQPCFPKNCSDLSHTYRREK